MESLHKRISDLREAASINQALFDAAISHAGMDHIAALAVGVEMEDDDSSPAGRQSDAAGWLPSSYGSTAGPKLRVAPQHHVDKTRKSLHQLYREWSAEGAKEREACFGPLLAVLDRHIPARPVRGPLQKEAPSVAAARGSASHPAASSGVSAASEAGGAAEARGAGDEDRSRRPRVLVAGAGLGRLLLELAGRGYRAVGCEFSYQMLLLGDLMLNGEHRFEVAPWAEEAGNHTRAAHQMRRVRVPDLLAADVSATAAAAGWALDMGMAAGEFVEAFGGPDQRGGFDAVLMPFFLDTAVIPPQYLRACASALRPGGLLVSLGPLQYHWNPGPPTALASRRAGAVAESAGEADSVPGGGRWARSVELTWEEMLLVVQAAGFAILEQRKVARLPYCHDQFSLRRHEYDGMLLVARLRSEPGATGGD